ncbi:MAG TPA: hypothetical protein VHE36_11640 [Sphingomicrobium sp.]|jgi:hypothetical protein|nr:hypothetical protein [Sphingomicrobium sp.]
MDDAEAPGEAAADRPQPRLRWLLDTQLLMTITTLVISLALAYFSFVQADASRKMQRTETWPYVSYSTDNASVDRKDEITFSLSNDGVGPARLEETEFLYDGKPMRDPREFVVGCCSTGHQHLVFTTADVGGVLRPGERRSFIRLARTTENEAIWERLNSERWKVVVRTCYCSIFDDCWVFDSRRNRPDPVKACPAGWTQFRERPDATTARG